MPNTRSWPSTAPRRAIQLAREHPIAAVFMLVAVATRLTFWLYTGRIWEDAIISLSPARNVWEGVGLTHHASEPRVHSFTSALGELILIFGEAFGPGHGLFAMRIASLLAAAASIYYAYRICLRLRLHWPAQVLVLGYLATDHLQIFFGMGGMETQVATALALANAHYYLDRRWRRLGVATGLAIICRPEFLLWPLIMAIALALEPKALRRKTIASFALPALLISAPWAIFATLYYGSALPHPIRVKSYGYRALPKEFRPPVIEYVQDWWRHVAPFRQYFAFAETPLPAVVLQGIVAVLLILAIAGAIHAVRIQPRMLAVLALLAGFVAYRTQAQVNPYFMWYLPPFTALYFLFAASGVSLLASRQRALGGIAGCLLFLAYAAHLPFTLPLDKRVQEGIEIDVRSRVGKILDGLMSDQDSVVLEPLGFIGWEARNKTIYDFPGLGSLKAFAAFKKHLSLHGLIIELSPRFLVLRPGEWETFTAQASELAARYEAVSVVRAKPGLSLSVPWRSL